MSSMSSDWEINEILSSLPKQHVMEGSKEANAYVCVDSLNRLSIFPKDGGWIGISIMSADLEADLAPFSD